MKFDGKRGSLNKSWRIQILLLIILNTIFLFSSTSVLALQPIQNHDSRLAYYPWDNDGAQYAAVNYDGFDDSGHPESVYVKENYAYVACGDQGLRIIDISDVSHPEQIWQINEYKDNNYCKMRGPGEVFVYKNYLFLVTSNSIPIFDISNPRNPIEVGDIYKEGHHWTTSFVIKGDYAFLANSGSDLEIYYILDPTNPIKVTKCNNECKNVILDIAIYDKKVYEITKNEIKIYDISDITSPVLIGSHYIYYANYNECEISGNYLFIADKDMGLIIYDVGSGIIRINPYGGGEAYDIAVTNNYAYVAYAYDGIQILDVSEPNEVVKIGHYNDGGKAVGIFVSENYIYIADYYSGLEIIDFSNLLAPHKVGQYYDGGAVYDVEINRNYAYIADGIEGLEIIDITDPKKPIEIGQYTNDNITKTVAINGKYAYLGDGKGITILDVSNPNSPINVGQYNKSCYINDIVITGDYAYCVSELEGFEIFDISNPRKPIKVGQYNCGEIPLNVVVSEKFAYVTYGSSGFRIIDIKNLLEPKAVGHFDDGDGYTEALIVREDFAYIADGNNGLEIIALSNHFYPYQKGETHAFEGYAKDIAMDGDYVLVADFVHGTLSIFNANNLLNPYELNFHGSYYKGMCIDITKSWAFVGTVDNGLQMFNIGYDSDGDGLSDYDEINTYGTDPKVKDCDGDGSSDGAEIYYGTNPRNFFDYPKKYPPKIFDPEFWLILLENIGLIAGLISLLTIFNTILGMIFLPLFIFLFKRRKIKQDID
jgi:hypothetical protein